MSEQYDEYINDHKAAVASAYRWIEKYIPEVLKPGFENTYEWACCFDHDMSKWDVEEYSGYDDYFYGNQSHAVVEAFDYAWLHHIHNNPHHWQHWILFEDDPKGGKPYRALEMPYPYVVEMICDWWSFSFRSGDLYEIFNWYDEHKATMVLHEKTRKEVEYILDKIKKKLDGGLGETTIEVKVVTDDKSEEVDL